MRSVNALLIGAMLASPALIGAVTFEPNRGQAPAAVRFLARTPHGPVLIERDRIRFGANRQDVISFAGGSAAGEGEGLGRTAGVTNYADPGVWDIPHYSGVRFRGIYRGIDLVYHDAQGRVEFDFEVAAQANPRTIELALEREGFLDVDGTLRSGEIALPKPAAWQTVDGRRVAVDVDFAMLGRKRVAFRLGDYRRDLPLTIDPILQFASYWGGSGDESSTRMLVSPSGDGAIFLAGNTLSEDFQAALPDEYGLNRPVLLLRPAAYVTRFTSGGTTVDWSIFLGLNQQLLDFKQDSLGNLYVLGTTTGRIAGTDSAFRKRLPPNGADWFVTKLDARTGRVKASTYLGISTNPSNGPSTAQLAVDLTGGVYVVGGNATLLYPTTAGALRSVADSPFVIRINSALTGLVYATYSGISAYSSVLATDVDASGNLWIGGKWGGSTPFPSVNPIPGINQMPQGVQQGYAMKLNSTGTTRLFSSHIHAGGGTDSSVLAIKVAPSGDVYVTGIATGTAFPVVNPMQAPVDSTQTYDYAAYPYVMKLAPEGTQIRSATFFKGLQAPKVGSIVLRPNGLPCYAGYEDNIPFKQTPGGLGTTGTRYGAEMTISCVDDLEREFVVKTRVPVAALYSDIAASSNDTILFAGQPGYPSLPESKTVGMVQPKSGGRQDAFFLKVSLVNPEPKISSVRPASVLINSSIVSQALGVVIAGTGFGDGMDVTFNGKAVTSSFDSSESVSLPAVDFATIRPGANAVTLALPGPGGGMSSGTLMGINASPTSVSVAPSFVQAGVGETKLVIRATNLSQDSVLRWNGQVRNANYVPDTPRGGHFEMLLGLEELSQAKTVEVTVTNPAPGGGTSPVVLFRVLPASTTTIPAISVGAITLVLGNAPVIPFAVTAQNVAPGARVTWDGQEIPTAFVSATRLDLSPSPDQLRFGVHRAYVTSGGVQSNTTVFPSGIAFSNNLAGVASPAGDRLYLVARSSFSVPLSEAPELFTLDSATGALLKRLPIKLMKNVNGPAKLAISSDGKFVYIASPAEGLIQRYNTETQSFDLEWVPYVPPTEGTRVGVASIATILNHPESVLVAYFTADGTNLAIFDNGMKRQLEWVNFNSDLGMALVSEDRVLLQCWAMLTFSEAGIAQQPYSCQSEPDGTITDETIRYFAFAGRNLLVSTPLANSSTGLFAILDLARRRAIQSVGTSQIWEYNIDTAEQRLRATTSFPTLLVNREDGGTLVLSLSSVFPVP